MQFTPYTIPLVVATLLTAISALIGWRRRENIGALTFTFVLIAISGWGLTFTIETSASSLSTKVLWAKAEYFFIVAIPVTWLIFSLQYARRMERLYRKYVVLLTLIPVTTVALVWTNEFHNLIWAQTTLDIGQSFSILNTTHGPFFWVHTAYSYILFGTGCGIILYAGMTSPHLYRNQSLVLLIGALVPWISNIVFLITGNPFEPFDTTPLAFSITGIAGMLVLFRYRLLDIIPMAYNAVTTSMTDGVIVIDDLNRVLDINPKAEQLTGVTARTLIGTPIDSVRSKIPQMVDIVKRPEESSFEFSNDEGNETQNYVVSTSTIRDSFGLLRGRLIIARNVTEHKRNEEILQRSRIELKQMVEERTIELRDANDKLQYELAERKRLEEQLLQSQKLEAMGRLSGGIAHDFNNMLSVILSYAELISMRLHSSDPLKNYVTEIDKAAERCANLTRQLLTFSRRQPVEPKLLNINDLIVDIENILRRLISENVEMVIVLDPNLGSVTVDPNQMEQVFINLVVNARDAMPNGGKVVVETSSASFDEAFAARNPEMMAGNFAVLSVTDDGVGMNEMVRQHIFEPFFTTKAIGEGAGIGLSTCYGIVKQAGGFITFDSKIGEGSVFQIYLPLTDNTAESHALDRDSDDMPSGSETILLVEDEPIVRMMTSEILTDRGYKILVASNGTDALRLFEESAASVNLVLTDVVMPFMGGRELAKRIREIREDIKVLYISGYSNDLFPDGVYQDEVVNFLQKPFTPTTLTKKIRDVLDG